MYEDEIKTSFIYLIVPSEKMQLQRPGRPHPTRQSRVVFEDVASVWVDEDAEGFQSIGCFGKTIRGRSREGASIHSHPGKQGTSLVWSEGIDFKHGHGMGTDWFLSEARNHEL